MTAKPIGYTEYGAAGPSVLQDVNVTQRRLPPENLHEVFLNPGAPVANRAVSREKPQGTPGTPPCASVLQQHVLFWDRDGDGVIWPWDTFIGFRRLGYNPLLSLMAVPALHTLAILTSPSWIPNPLLPIHIRDIHKTKHGSDTGVYDTEGRFVPQKFEEMFSKHADGKHGMNLRDLQRMWNTNCVAGDFFGWLATRGEWIALWLVAADENGFISKEKIRGQYDGSLWQQIADEVEAKRAQRANPFSWRHKLADHQNGTTPADGEVQITSTGYVPKANAWLRPFDSSARDVKTQ